jgi:ribosomal protein S24E
MEFKIIQEKENSLLNRKEFTYEVKEEIIPSKETVKEELSKKYGFEKDLIEVLKISGKFGVKVFEVVAQVYHNKEEMNRTVLKSKKQRDAEAKALAEANKTKEEGAK